jgi:sirohydrochlorin ferrochelatase
MASMIESARTLGEQIVKRKAKKVEMFLAMLEDPDLQELVSALRNGQPTPARPEHKFAPGLTQMILTLRAASAGRFTADDMQKKLEAQHFEFTGDHRRAVRDALSRLANNSHLKVVEAGKGGRPSVYEWS